MSSERGNVKRRRPQRHQNKTVFKNNLHDSSPGIKLINGLSVNQVCERCKSIIEWKIKYKKYKPLKAPAVCVKCKGRNVKHAYHNMCQECSSSLKVCPKCGNEASLVQSTEKINFSFDIPEVKDMMEGLSERKRRTFKRYVERTLSEDPSAYELIIDKLQQLVVSSSKDSTFSNDSEEDDLNDLD